MKKTIFVAILSLLFVGGCSDSSDTAGSKTEEQASEATGATDSSSQTIDDASQAAKDTAEKVVTEGKELAETTAATADSVVQEAKQAAGDAADKVAAATDTGNKGEETYKAKCFACHGTGVAGAPKLGDTANWAPRIAQGEDVMVKHAIEGFTGKAGVMPPKGGAMDLTDDQIRGAVVYMVAQSK